MTRIGRADATRGLFAVALAASLFALGCGDDDGGDETATTGADAAGLAAIKGYLTDHTEDLNGQVDVMTENAERYYELVEAADFDYQTLMDENGEEVADLLAESKEAFQAANPAYEEMEGIVAGVPRLAQYDVDIDAGSDASDPESAVSFSLDVPGGKTLKQPGNLFFLTETALYGTNDELLADAPQDVDGDGKESFGEGLPDAKKYVATLRKFDEMTDDLAADAETFEPTPSDAFTAITVMTPTMSEYFEAWKNSRFISGSDATELGFVATSRLSDIADILEGIRFTYDEVQPLVEAEAPQQAKQTARELERLIAFVTELRDREEQGTKFSGEQADTLGSEAQARAEEVAGQVTQAAQRLGIELQDS
jgi:Imelysin